jgi:hypothetical protein
MELVYVQYMLQYFNVNHYNTKALVMIGNLFVEYYA